jgi:hypothetical protein
MPVDARKSQEHFEVCVTCLIAPLPVQLPIGALHVLTESSTGRMD